MVLHLLAVPILAAGLSAEISRSELSSATAQATRPTAAPACDRAPHACAAQHIEKGDVQAAILLLEESLARAPRDLRLRNLLGIALTAAGRVDEGSREFGEALSLDPSFVPARKNLAINEFNQGRLDAAERLFREVIARAPLDEVAHVHLAEIHVARKQPAAAVPHYEKSGARLSANPAWILHYASILLDQGDTAKAAAILDRLPVDSPGHFDAGVVLARAGAHGDAARHFGLARSTYRDPEAAGYNQLLMLIDGGDFDRAIRVAEELLRVNPRSGELFNLASRAYLGARKIQEAYDALRTAARLEPTAEHHYTDLALICIDHENYELGIEIVDVGLTHKPASAGLRLYRGVLLVMKGLVENAEREFETAMALAPQATLPPVALAMAWMQSGRTLEAVTLLRTRVQAGVREAIVPYMFGVALLRSGIDPTDEEAAEAMRAFEAAIELDARFAGPRTELGKILLRRGRTEQAIAQLEQAVALDPDNPSPAYSLAQAYRRTRNTARAQELLARVSRLNAEGRSDDPDRELQRMVVRIVREGAPAPRTSGK